MPFESKAQMKMMFARKPGLAKKFASESKGQDNSKLPEHKGKLSPGMRAAVQRRLKGDRLKKSGKKNGDN